MPTKKLSVEDRVRRVWSGDDYLIITKNHATATASEIAEMVNKSSPDMPKITSKDIRYHCRKLGLPKKEHTIKARLGTPYEPLDGEEWRLIEDYPPYEVSNLGRVRDTELPDMILAVGHYNNPRVTRVWLPKYHQQVRLSLIVAKAWLGKCTGECVLHRDRDYTNNAADNLIYINRKNIRGYMYGKTT